MAKNKPPIENIEQIPLRDFVEKAYLDYSMYVILDRALPHLADGLKPVQRRIIYAMSELGLKATAKYKKSARTIGDVLGKFHPHGDSACYEAMVLMAQSFSYRYPLVDGQGNWGSPDDPKSFAAMRYTEARLAAYAEILLRELEQGTTDWQPNFDGTLEEPRLLPAELPNLLLNGTTGIAVGMATDIPPHNMREVIDACVHLLANPKASVNDLCQYVKGPDYPTDAEIITPKQDILDMYAKGSGSIRMRATYTEEDEEIVITALPHQVSGSKILEQIAAQMQTKKLPMLGDLRDESDHENPVRLVLVPKSARFDVENLMRHLFATTDLETTYRVNLNMIGLDNRPQVKNLKMILSEWLHFRRDTVRRRLQSRLEKVAARLHILDGLLIAYLNIDDVIRVIREEEHPKQALMKRFKLSELQADAILELKLRHLAKLEEIKIKADQKELSEEHQKLAEILGSESKMTALIKKELLKLYEQLGDARRSKLVARAEAAVAMTQEEQIPADPITVILSEKGWVRQAKGHEVDGTSLSYKSGDAYLNEAKGKANQPALFVDSVGRSYTLMPHNLASARGYGEPLTSRLSPPSGATFVDVIMCDPKQLLVMASSAGYGFIVPAEELISKNKNGKQILKVPDGCTVVKPAHIDQLAKDQLAVITQQGRVLVFPAQDLPMLNKGKGNKLIQIDNEDLAAQQDGVRFIIALAPKATLTVQVGTKKLTLSATDLKEYHGERGRRGKFLPNAYRKVTGIVV